MSRLTGRSDLRNDHTRYEAIGLLLVNLQEDAITAPVPYPSATSGLYFDGFFPTLYRQYDLRFVYGAAALAPRTRRLQWDPNSPVLALKCEHQSADDDRD